MAETRKTDKTDKPDIGTVVGSALLEFARLGRLTDATYDRLSDEYDPKPEPGDEPEPVAADLTDAERRELAEFRAARDADKTEPEPAKATAGTSKGAKS